MFFNVLICVRASDNFCLVEALSSNLVAGNACLRWTYAKFQLIDVLPFAVASLFGSRRQRKTAKKTLYILRSVYATLIQFYASSQGNR